MKEKKKISLLFPILFAVLILYSVILFALFIWGFLTAMRENLGFISDPFGFEGGHHIDNFEKAFFLFQTTVKGVDGGYRTVYIEEMFLNSLIYFTNILYPFGVFVKRFVNIIPKRVYFI